MGNKQGGQINVLHNVQVPFVHAGFGQSIQCTEGLVQKGNTALAEAIDAVLSTMTEDDFNALMDQAISIQPEI